MKSPSCAGSAPSGICEAGVRTVTPGGPGGVPDEPQGDEAVGRGPALLAGGAGAGLLDLPAVRHLVHAADHGPSLRPHLQPGQGEAAA